MTKDYLIIADGDRHPHRDDLTTDKTVIALDGAADYLHDAPPHIILGDLDSIQDPAFWGIDKYQYTPYSGTHNTLIVPTPDQDQTDLQKAIIYADENGATSILIVNATGKRLDHTLANLRLLRAHHHPKRRLTLMTATETVHFIKNATFSLSAPANTPCAILSFPAATITTSGLRYDSINAPLEFGLSESICNHTTSNNAQVTVNGEALIIYESPTTRH